jgi:2'-5' RNA ligase
VTRAIDIALLLPGEVSALAVDLNRRLDGGQPEGLTLDGTHLPHITLVQLFAREERLEELFRRVDGAAAGFPGIELRVKGLDDGTDTAMLVFEENRELRALHAALIDAAREFEVPGGAASFDTRPGERPARDRDVAWVSSYSREHSLEQFLPHVTVGHGAGAGPVAPFPFTAGRLAVCHLGRHCTCRTVLHERRLRGGGHSNPAAR